MTFEMRLEPLRRDVLAGQWSSSLPSLVELIQKYPQCQLAHALLSRCLLKLGQSVQARRQALYGLVWGIHKECLVALEEACNAERDFIGASFALLALRKCLPNDPYVALRLGNNAYEQGDWKDALKFFNESIALDPMLAAAHMNTGFIYKMQEEYEKALACYQKALELESDDADTHWNMSQLLLLLGRYAEGLREAEWRWKKADFPSRPRNFTQPLWKGEIVDTLLIYGEQGFGDCIQMLRYLPFAARKTRRTILEIQPELYRLVMAQRDSGRSDWKLPGNVEVIQMGGSLPSFDACVPMMTLPLSLGMTQLDDPPGSEGYLDAPSGISFKDNGKPDRLLKVGIVWRGRSSHPHDHLRSFGLEDVAPLFGLSGIQWVSLQKTPDTDVRQQLQSAGLICMEMGSGARDFYDTATYLKSLDLLITTDTSVAHLAGALGIETWVGLMKVPDWRWGISGQDTPWYKCMRLFRQTDHRSWEAVFTAMFDDLRKRVTINNQYHRRTSLAVEYSRGGLDLREKGQLLEALKHQEDAYKLDPHNLAIKINLAVSLQDTGKLDEAVEIFGEVAQQSDAPLARVNYGMALLRNGRFAEGFQEYLWRWQEPRWPQKPYNLPFPHLLQADKVLDSPVVIMPDQGYGDTIMVLPWIYWLLENNPKATVVVKPPLLSFFRNALPKFLDRVCRNNDQYTSGWVTGFDIPALFPDVIAEYFRYRLIIQDAIRSACASSVPQYQQTNDFNEKIISLVWKGSPDHGLDAWRSVPVETLVKIIDKENIKSPFMVLLPERDPKDIRLFESHSIRTNCPTLQSFKDTAFYLLKTRALLTVDTATAHLAGVLGVPTVVLISAMGDWRWSNMTNHSFWYPSVHIERQKALGDWHDAVSCGLQWILFDR